MQQLRLTTLQSTHSMSLCVALLLGACGEDKSGGDASPPDAPSTTRTPSTTGPVGGPTTTGASGPTGATSSAGPTGGTASGSPVGPSGSSATTDSTTGPTAGGGTLGPAPSSDASGVTTDDASGGPTGEPSTSSAEPTPTGEDTSAPVSTECTRELLDGLLDDYFAALSAGDPSGLPLAADVKFTENAQIVDIGSTEFWKNAGDTKYSQRALDTVQCTVAAQAVIPENTTDLPVGLRIKVEAGQMTEIETIVVRQGDYTASFAVDSNPGAIIAIADEIGWHDEVPEAERATREQLSNWVEKYFRAFPSGVCDVTSACRRLENGGGNFSCSTGASCSAGQPTTGGAFEPRVIVVDEVRGIAAGFTIFDFQTTGHLDMHMMKMSGGEVHAVQAILRDTNGESGWE